MRYIMTLVWAFLIGLVITYVITSMAGADFSFTYVIVITAVFFLAVVVLGDGLLKEKSEH